jgi:ATP-independent RNA helicase DbpA
LQRRTLSLEHLRILVLDEADRMLDMGFQEEMEALLAACPRNRQTLLFSATFPEELSQKFLADALRVEAEETPPPIRQLFCETSEDKKSATLVRCLQWARPETALVFCNLKATVTRLQENLQGEGIPTAGLHGDLDQTDRDRVMAKFRNGSTRLVLATDVAARGIDISGLDLVVNFDLPKPDTYVHRIGRTGRAGKAGLAICLVCPQEKEKLRLLQGRASFDRLALPLEMPAVDWSSPFITLYIGGGRKDKVRPGDLLGALTGDAGGLPAEQVGKIEIHDRFSYVAIRQEQAKAALQSLREGRIKGRKFRIELVS